MQNARSQSGFSPGLRSTRDSPRPTSDHAECCCICALRAPGRPRCLLPGPSYWCAPPFRRRISGRLRGIGCSPRPRSRQATQRMPPRPFPRSPKTDRLPRAEHHLELPHSRRSEARRARSQSPTHPPRVAPPEGVDEAPVGIVEQRVQTAKSMVSRRGGPAREQKRLQRQLNALRDELIRGLQTQRRKDANAAKHIATHSLERGQDELRIDLRLPGELLCKHCRRHRERCE